MRYRSEALKLSDGRLPGLDDIHNAHHVMFNKYRSQSRSADR
jgi:hypothetical protein